MSEPITYSLQLLSKLVLVICSPKGLADPGMDKHSNAITKA